MRYARHIYHVFSVRAPGRDRIIEALAESGIACGVHYPVPIHLQNAYANLGQGVGSFPVAERCAQEFISLPMFPELSEEQISYVGHELARLAKAPSGAR
jgi:dTDP-4-amino-4,6-dideoxygalactose transaminase